ncbi:MAG: hypothetical protein NZ805_10650 [Armatimonadetes bacterium]|nr:hypothetical protein [Armatimonadota bacterium]
MLQREVPIWVAVIVVIIVVLVIAVIYWLRQPRAREGATPPPDAPIFKAGPGLGGEKPVEIGKPVGK